MDEFECLKHLRDHAEKSQGMTSGLHWAYRIIIGVDVALTVPMIYLVVGAEDTISLSSRQSPLR